MILILVKKKSKRLKFCRKFSENIDFGKYFQKISILVNF